MNYTHLTREERGKIESYLDEKLSPAEIARILGRHRSTIVREIKRGSEEKKFNSTVKLRYQADSAGNLARVRKRNCGTISKVTIHNTKTKEGINHDNRLFFTPFNPRHNSQT